jgi:hypothetical protein
MPASSSQAADQLVQLGGLEPPTSCSTDRRSNQLSYNCILGARGPKKGGSRTGRKLGATTRFGKAGSRQLQRLPAFAARTRGTGKNVVHQHLIFSFLIPVPKTSLILLVPCPMRGRFLEAILQRIERKLARPGRPGTVDELVAGGALGGAAPRLGRARSPCRARWVHRLPPRVPIGALAPPTAPSPRAVREGLANLGRFAPRECETMPSFRGACALRKRTRNPDVVNICGPIPLDSVFAPRGAPRNDE